jgi:hypothetical protein
VGPGFSFLYRARFRGRPALLLPFFHVQLLAAEAAPVKSAKPHLRGAGLMINGVKQSWHSYSYVSNNAFGEIKTRLSPGFVFFTARSLFPRPFTAAGGKSNHRFVGDADGPGRVQAILPAERIPYTGRGTACLGSESLLLTHWPSCCTYWPQASAVPTCAAEKFFPLHGSLPNGRLL